MGRQKTADELKGRVALVTGAAGGLGSALVHSLAQRGATVLACDVDVAGLERVASEGQGKIIQQQMNLADAEDIERSVEIIMQEHGAVDILIHAAVRHFAGDDGNEARAFINHTPAQVMETLAVAVTGPTLLTQLVAKQMVRQRTGRIVLIGSMHRTGTPGIVMYSAAKAYLNALARGLFLELRDYNIITSVANPGGMHTGLHNYRYPWMLNPSIVAETIAGHLTMPEGVALLSFDIVPHDPEHPDAIS